ncbi:MAG: hypothetical protein AB1601_08220 [Planctomycetota bacterium]
MPDGDGHAQPARIRSVLRRWVAAGLAGAGALILWRVVEQHGGDVWRAAPVGILTAGGGLLNLLSAARAHMALRRPVRLTACAFGIVLAGGLISLGHYIDTELAAAGPKADADMRLALRQWQTTLQWLALGVGYLVVSLALLPGPAPRSGPRP